MYNNHSSEKMSLLQTPDFSVRTTLAQDFIVSREMFILTQYFLTKTKANSVLRASKKYAWFYVRLLFNTALISYIFYTIIYDTVPLSNEMVQSK